MMRNIQRRPSRTGFTLVEMLVATALIIFVMLILTTAFTAGLGALRIMRGVGHLQEQLRYATSVLRRDLAAPHFGREQTALKGPYLSQQRLDMYDWSPPKEGFFRIWQGKTSVYEGGTYPNGAPIVTDGDGLASYAMDASGLSYLHFTVRSEPGMGQGSGRDKYFSTRSLKSSGIASANITKYSKREYLYVGLPDIGPYQLLDDAHQDDTFYSSWAEVAYFIQPSGQLAGSSSLYTLYRRRRLLIDSRFPVSLAPVTVTPAIRSTLADVSFYEQPTAPPLLALNTPGEVTAPFRRFNMTPTIPAGVSSNTYPNSTPNPNSLTPIPATDVNSGGDDILLENVLSFDVKAIWESPYKTDPVTGLNKGDSRFPLINDPRSFATNSDNPFDDLPATPAARGNTSLASPMRVFDTWSSAGNYSVWKNRYMSSDFTLANGPYTIPLRVRVKALQIRIRVWDIKTQQTRQVTIIQDV
jgi:type II secretory pathway pseudopilin PulG